MMSVGMGDHHLKDYFNKSNSYLGNLQTNPHRFRDGESKIIQ